MSKERLNVWENQGLLEDESTNLKLKQKQIYESKQKITYNYFRMSQILTFNDFDDHLLSIKPVICRMLFKCKLECLLTSMLRLNFEISHKRVSLQRANYVIFDSLTIVSTTKKVNICDILTTKWI